MNEDSIEKSLETKIKIITKQYNDTLYRAIRMTPNEAWANPNNLCLRYENSKEGIYINEFTKTFR